MNQSIINKYQIKFYNKILNFPSGKQISKIPDTNHEISLFLIEWNPDDITNYLVPNINSVINNSLPEFETGSTTCIVLVDPTNTVFYPDNVTSSFPTMPTQEFIEIVQGWRDFLLQPPVNGSSA